MSGDNTKPFTGRAALVTGAGSGLGRAIAMLLGERGASVAATDIDHAAATRSGSEIAEASGGKTIAVEHDVREPDSCDQAVSQCTQAFGRLDVVVNAAGVSRAIAFQDIDAAEWDRVNDVNAKGTFLVCKAAAREMIQARRGRIVNISSMAGKEGLELFTHYCASKFAVIGITQSIAKELASFNVTVNAVCPGVVRTPLWDPLLKQLASIKGVPETQAWDEFEASIPLGRAPEPTDIAEAVAFLVSDRARSMTGQAINVTGGVIMH